MLGFMYTSVCNLMKVAIFVTFVNSGQCQPPSVETPLGTIVGVQHSITFDGVEFSVRRYFGIPYAQAPVGPLRFQKPQPFGNFTDGSFEATRFGNSCPQFDASGMETEPFVTTEDCLFLNVYAPSENADMTSGHAVMIFLHGGGLVTGSSRNYLADTLAATGNVIVVTIHYRLWMFGLLKLNDPRTPGNLALWDQNMAFQWVHDNIGSFGGDTKRVTIFGQSAGAACVALQALYPGNHGLFQSVIAQSGSAFMTGMVGVNTEDVAKLMADKLECDSQTSDQVLKCLMDASSDDIVKTLQTALLEDAATGGMLQYFLPTIDGEFIKRDPRELLSDQDGQSEEIKFLRSLNLMAGFNADEGYFHLMGLPGAMSDSFTISQHEMSMYIPSAYSLAFLPPTGVPESISELVLHKYTNWTDPRNPSLLTQQYSKLLADLTFSIPQVEFSRIHANYTDSNSYTYHFMASMNGHVMPLPGWATEATHGDELAPLFGFQFPLQKNGTITTPQQWEINLSKRMIRYWTNFAKTGNPNGPGTSMWPKYTVDSQEYLSLDRTDSPGQFLHADEVHFWRQVVPSLMETISTTSAPTCPPITAGTTPLTITTMTLIATCLCFIISYAMFHRQYMAS